MITDVMDEHERAATERKKRVEKYFNRTPAPRELWQALAALGLGGGVLVLGAALASTTTTFLLRVSAISLIVAGVIILLKGGELKWRYDRTLRAAEPKPTDSGMDELLRSDLAAVRDRALDRLGVMTEDLEIDDPHDPLGGVVAPESPGDLTPASGLDSRDRQPLVVHGPWDATHTVIANDGRWRFGKYQVMVICPTRHHLAIYVCLLNFLTGGLEGEWTQEYHYVDVVAVGTTTDADEVARLRLIDRNARDRVRFARRLVKEFQVVVSSGDRARVVVGFLDVNRPDHEERTGGAHIDDVIGAVRRVLREKKGGTIERVSAMS